MMSLVLLVTVVTLGIGMCEGGYGHEDISCMIHESFHV